MNLARWRRRLVIAAVALGVVLPALPAGAQAPPPTQPVSGTPAGAVDKAADTNQGVGPVSPNPPQVNPPAPAKRFSPFPALPAGSGTGRRIVYANRAQRVWLVEADGRVVKSHRVSGRIGQPPPGTYSVYSKAINTYSMVHPWITWSYMVRFYRTPSGNNIGFHEIPSDRGRKLQTEAQLGLPLSSGCVRQSTPDAIYVWNWAPVGTRVVVLP